MKAKFALLLVPLLVFSFGLTYGESISLERVEGLYGTSTDSVVADGSTLITFYLRVTGGTIDYGAIANGFRVYSDDGAEWSGLVGDTVYVGFRSLFDLIFAIQTFSVTGNGADTVGFGGSKMFNTGLPAGFDEEAYSITVGPIETAHHGKTICLDSSYYPPTGSWKWAGATDAFPDWDGPHCYTVVDPAQLGISSLAGDALPTRFDLGQNYPNPFNPTTELKFDVPSRSFVSISIYNVLGQQVRTLVNEELEAKSYVVDWDGTSDGGAKVASGIYFYRMEAGSFVETKKMMLLK